MKQIHKSIVDSDILYAIEDVENSTFRDIQDMVNDIVHNAKDFDDSEYIHIIDLDNVKTDLYHLGVKIHKELHNTYQYPANWERCHEFCGDLAVIYSELVKRTGI